MKTNEPKTTWNALQDDLKKAMQTWEDIKSQPQEELQKNKEYKKYQDLFKEIESKIKDLS